MREIKFRGKNSPQHSWVYGYYHTHYDGSFFHLISKVDPEEMATHEYPVDERSVGQFTGRIDLNGIEIYEGDIIKVPYGKGKVEYASNQGMFIITWIDDKEANNEALAYDPHLYKYGRARTDLEVIGNIYDNPELAA